MGQVDAPERGAVREGEIIDIGHALGKIDGFQAFAPEEHARGDLHQVRRQAHRAQAAGMHEDAVGELHPIGDRDAGHTAPRESGAVNVQDPIRNGVIARAGRRIKHQSDGLVRHGIAIARKRQEPPRIQPGTRPHTLLDQALVVRIVVGRGIEHAVQGYEASAGPAHIDALDAGAHEHGAGADEAVLITRRVVDLAVAKGLQGGREGDLLELPAALESAVANDGQALRQGDAFQVGAVHEHTIADRPDVARDDEGCDLVVVHEHIAVQVAAAVQEQPACLVHHGDPVVVARVQVHVVRRQPGQALVAGLDVGLRPCLRRAVDVELRQAGTVAEGSVPDGEPVAVAVLGHRQRDALQRLAVAEGPFSDHVRDAQPRLPQGRAVGEGPVAHGDDAVQPFHALQHGAEVEHVRGQLVQLQGQADPAQARAIHERSLADLLNVVGQVDRLQGIASREGARSNALESLRQHDLRQLTAARKGAVADLDRILRHDIPAGAAGRAAAKDPAAGLSIEEHAILDREACAVTDELVPLHMGARERIVQHAVHDSVRRRRDGLQSDATRERRPLDQVDAHRERYRSDDGVARKGILPDPCDAQIVGDHGFAVKHAVIPLKACGALFLCNDVLPFDNGVLREGIHRALVRRVGDRDELEPGGGAERALAYGGKAVGQIDIGDAHAAVGRAGQDLGDALRHLQHPDGSGQHGHQPGHIPAVDRVVMEDIFGVVRVDIHAFKGVAAAEHAHAQLVQPGGHAHAGQRRAVREGLVADGGRRVGEDDRGHARVAAERAFADGGHALGHDHAAVAAGIGGQHIVLIDLEAVVEVDHGPGVVRRSKGVGGAPAIAADDREGVAAVEVAVAEREFAVEHVDLLKRRAAREGGFAHARQGGRQRHVPERGTVFKRARADGGHALRQHELPQPRVAGERARRDGGHAVGDPGRGKLAVHAGQHAVRDRVALHARVGHIHIQPHRRDGRGRILAADQFGGHMAVRRVGQRGIIARQYDPFEHRAIAERADIHRRHARGDADLAQPSAAGKRAVADGGQALRQFDGLQGAAAVEGVLPDIGQGNGQPDDDRSIDAREHAGIVDAGDALPDHDAEDAAVPHARGEIDGGDRSGPVDPQPAVIRQHVTGVRAAASHHEVIALAERVQERLVALLVHLDGFDHSIAALMVQVRQRIAFKRGVRAHGGQGSRQVQPPQVHRAGEGILAQRGHAVGDVIFSACGERRIGHQRLHVAGKHHAVHSGIVLVARRHGIGLDARAQEGRGRKL